MVQFSTARQVGQFCSAVYTVWYARYRDHNDIEKQVSTRCTDKEAAQQVLANLVAESEKIKSGIKTPKEASAAGHIKQPITEHIETYIEYLKHKTTRGRKTSQVHLSNVTRQLKRLANDCGFCWINDISKGKVAKWMNEQAGIGKMSGRTINTYRAAVLTFVRWLVAEDRLVTNPLEGLYTADQMEKRRRRRALTGEEIAKLLEAARTRPLQNAMTIKSGKRKGQVAAKIRPKEKKRLIDLGHERALIYETMIYTGLRKNELATLTVDDLFLNAKQPFIRLKSKNSKNALADQIPLRADLSAKLRKWISCKLPGAKVLYVPHDLHKILYRDLKQAGIPRVDDQGRRIDVHALRHTCGTQLAKAGILPQEVSRIMRHSSMDLTMDYTHLTLVDTGRAVEKVPDFTANVIMKTGTDDVVAMLKDQKKANQKGPENSTVFSSFIGNSCQQKGIGPKQAGLGKVTQPVDNKRVGTDFHQMSKCPGEDSNLHEPKLTSPSS